MRSFQILQLLTDPNENKTSDSLPEIPEASALPDKVNNPVEIIPLYSDTVTDPNDDQVYEVSTDDLDELALLMSNLKSGNNYTRGGNCLPPTVNLFNQSDCLDHNSTNPQVWNSTIQLNVCNTTNTVNKEALLATLTLFCGAITPNGDDDANAYDIINYTLCLLLILMLGVLAGIVLTCRGSQENENRRSWLHQRGGDSLQQSSLIIQELEDDDHALADGDELYDDDVEQKRNSQGYSQLSMGRR
jgi:hypothetical protein